MTVPEGGVAEARVNYQRLQPGILRVVVRGLPQEVGADVRVRGHSGLVEERVTAPGTTDLTLPPTLTPWTPSR